MSWGRNGAFGRIAKSHLCYQNLFFFQIHQLKMDANKMMTIEEIKAKEKEEKLKHNEMIEMSKKICEIKVDINKSEIAFVQGQKEFDVLMVECIDLRTSIQIEKDKLKMLEDSIKDLENILDETKNVLEEESNKVHSDIMEFIEESETFLTRTNRLAIQELNLEEIGEEDVKKIELDGEIAALQLFLNTQRRLLNCLN